MIMFIFSPSVKPTMGHSSSEVETIKNTEALGDVSEGCMRGIP
jgi:hypothetical protein